MQDTARVVVIGGGVVGCSVLYHLARAGWTDIVLLERSELTSGSTWHAAGGIHTINGDPNVAKLQKYTVELYREIERESGQNVGLHMTGGLMMAATPERFDWLKSIRAKGRYMGLDAEIITPEEAAELFPLLDPSQFVGGLRDEVEGHVDPSGTTHAYAKAARKLGATVHTHTMVTALAQRADGTWVVTTEKGQITAEHVVNAGGLWAREVGRMAGLELPVLAMEHMYLLTEEIPEVVEFNQTAGREMLHVVDFDGEIYTRQEGRGMLIGTYEADCRPWSPDSTPWDFGHELLPPDLDRIAPRLEGAFRHFPPYERAGIKQIINGPFTFSPDGNPLVGPVRGMRGYWCACGVMAGFAQGGGVGLALANWMTEGDPGFDVFAMDVARFGDYATSAFTNARVRQNYARRFSIRFPNEELPAARPLLTTPIHDLLKAEGCQFGEARGLEVPLWFAPEGVRDEFSWRRSTDFDPVGAEARAVREGVGILEITGFAKYRVTGAAAAAWLDRILAARVPEVGRMVLAPMLKEDGKLIGDFTLARLAPEEFLIAGSGVAEDYHMRWFLQHLDEGISVVALGPSLAGLSIAGPKSREVLAAVAGTDVSGEAFRFMDIRGMHVGMAPCTVGRISFTGDLGYEILDGAGVPAPRLQHPEGGRRSARHSRLRPAGAQRAEAGEGVGRLGARVPAGLLAVGGGARPLRRSGQGRRLHRQGGRAGDARQRPNATPHLHGRGARRRRHRRRADLAIGRGRGLGDLGRLCARLRRFRGIRLCAGRTFRDGRKLGDRGAWATAGRTAAAGAALRRERIAHALLRAPPGEATFAGLPPSAVRCRLLVLLQGNDGLRLPANVDASKSGKALPHNAETDCFWARLLTLTLVTASSAEAPGAVLEDDGDDEFLLVHEMTVQESAEPGHIVAEYTDAVAKIVAIQPLQHRVRTFDERIEVAVERVMVSTEDVEAPLQRGFSCGQDREVVNIFDVVMAVQFAHEHRSVSRKAAAVILGRRIAVDQLLGVLLK